MDIKELDRLAKDNAPMPDGLALYEQCYYISSRGLYEQYAREMITLEVAKKEKAQVIKQYELGKEQWQLFLGLYEIHDKLSMLKVDGFNSFLEFEIMEIVDKLL